MAAKQSKKPVGGFKSSGVGKVISISEYHEARSQTGPVIIYASNEMIAFLEQLKKQPGPIDKVVPVYDGHELYFFRKMIVSYLVHFAEKVNPGASFVDLLISIWQGELKLIHKTADLIRANPRITNKQKDTLLSNLLFHYKIATHMSHNSDLSSNPLFAIISFFDNITKESFDVDGNKYSRTGYPETKEEFENLLNYYIEKYGRRSDTEGKNRTVTDLLATLDELEKNFNDEFGASKRVDHVREIDLIRDFRGFLDSFKQTNHKPAYIILAHKFINEYDKGPFIDDHEIKNLAKSFGFSADSQIRKKADIPGVQEKDWSFNGTIKSNRARINKLKYVLDYLKEHEPDCQESIKIVMKFLTKGIKKINKSNDL